jgi:hypothetical protein
MSGEERAGNSRAVEEAGKDRLHLGSSASPLSYDRRQAAEGGRRPMERAAGSKVRHLLR